MGCTCTPRGTSRLLASQSPYYEQGLYTPPHQPFLHLHSHCTQVYSIIVVALFLATELYPFLAALDDEVLLAMSAEDVARAGGGSDGTDPGRNRGGREAEEAG